MASTNTSLSAMTRSRETWPRHRKKKRERTARRAEIARRAQAARDAAAGERSA